MTMRQLGLSIYPDHSDFEANAAYLKLGHQYGFTRIFMSMLEVSGTVAETKAKYQKIIDVGNQLGYQTILDVSPRIFKQLGISYKDLICTLLVFGWMKALTAPLKPCCHIIHTA